MSKVVLIPGVDGGTNLRISRIVTMPPSHTPAGSELHLGSQDLIRFASYAAERGFVVSSFMLADAFLVPLDSDEEDEVSAEMTSMVLAHGTDELEAAMQEEYEGLYVVGVNLIASSSGMRIMVRRRGFVETSVVQEAERLLESAWRELRLS